MSQVTSFPPIAAADARILILGSMPGTASLAAGQYYAHPRNAFWPIMTALLSLPEHSDYAARSRALTGAGIALWDVMQQCVRPGSLDARIDRTSIVANDFRGFLARHRQVERVYFNGATAAQTWHRHVAPVLDPPAAALPTVRLPSTSPAHAAMGFEQKLAVWREQIVLP